MPVLSTGRFYQSGVPVVPIVYGTLNPLDKEAFITLSNGNLTATRTFSTTWVSVRSTTSHSSGKYYYEWLPIEFSGSYISGGFANSSASLSNYAGVDANGISLVTDGNIYKSGAATASGVIPTEGSVIGLAIDLDADLFWCRKDGGAWSSGDPAAGTGGLALPAGMTSGDVFAAISLQSPFSPDTATVNFGASGFANGPPSGFSAWG